jgi:hypothetical protein
MQVFDYYWPKSMTHKKEALRQWAAALLESLVLLDSEIIADVTGHVMVTLTTPGLAPTQRQFDLLKSDLLSWMSKSFSASGASDIVMQQLAPVSRFCLL